MVVVGEGGLEVALESEESPFDGVEYVGFGLLGVIREGARGMRLPLRRK